MIHRSVSSPTDLVAGSEISASADFSTILQNRGLYPATRAFAGQPSGMNGLSVGHGAHLPTTEATTILAFKYQNGILMAGDRRATAGNAIVYDRADKVLEIDRHSLMAIAGVPATAWEMARVLEHSFQFYRRTQLQELSLDGKVRALSKLLRDNLGMVLQGVGVVIPLFAAWDTVAAQPRLYFYDALGAGFEAAEYATSGSGSPSVRAILHYENVWGKKPLRHLQSSEALIVALRALETAAENDSATGGVDRRTKIFPIVKLITQDGISTLPEQELTRAFQSAVQTNRNR